MLTRSLLLLLTLCGLPLCGQESFEARWQSIRDSASPRQLYAFLQALPKGGDLHHHSTLSFYAHHVLPAAIDIQRLGYRYYTRTRAQNCADNENGPILLYQNLPAATHAKLSPCRQEDYTPLDRLTAAQKQAWLSAHILDEPGENRNEFFEEIVARLTPLSRNPHLFAELFAQNLKLFAAEGVRYVEGQWGPFNQEKPDGTLYTPDEAIAIVRARLEQPDVKGTGIEYRFQTTIIRFRADVEEQIARLHQFTAAHRDLFVGINAAGREDNDKGHALRMLNAFRQARRTYGDIPLSLHAGEKDSPGPEVRNTLLLGARRIGHGLNLIHDPDTMLLMRNGPYLVEINLVSNRLLDYVPNLEEHPFPEYLRFGIPVCLNTDDRGSWDSNMTDEYFHAARLFRLSWAELTQLGRNSLEHAFAPAALKQRMLAAYERDLAAFTAKWQRADWAAALEAAQPEVSGYAKRNLLR